MHEEILQGRISGKFLCSVRGHLASSGIITAPLSPLHSVPQTRLHTLAASKVHTRTLTVFSAARWKEENCCRRGEDDSRKGTADAKELGVLSFCEKSEIQLHWQWKCSVQVSTESCPQLQSWWWQEELLSQRTLQQLGRSFWGAMRHWLLHITWWFPWETAGEGQGMGKLCVNNFKILENSCLCFAWCWTDSPGRKTAAIQSIVPTKSCRHASPLSRLDWLPGHEHTTSHATRSLSCVSCEAARL